MEVDLRAERGADSAAGCLMGLGVATDTEEDEQAGRDLAVFQELLKGSS